MCRGFESLLRYQAVHSILAIQLRPPIASMFPRLSGWRVVLSCGFLRPFAANSQFCAARLNSPLPPPQGFERLASSFRDCMDTTPTMLRAVLASLSRLPSRRNTPRPAINLIRGRGGVSWRSGEAYMPSRSSWAFQLIGKFTARVSLAIVRSAGCEPLRIASVILGERKAMGRMRLMSDA